MLLTVVLISLSGFQIHRRPLLLLCVRLICPFMLRQQPKWKDKLLVGDPKYLNANLSGLGVASYPGESILIFKVLDTVRFFTTVFLMTPQENFLNWCEVLAYNWEAS